MNFTKNEKFRLEQHTVVVVFSAPDLIVFEAPDGSHMAYSMTDIESMYLAQKLTPLHSTLELDDKYFEITYRFLTEFQKKELRQKLLLVQFFVTNRVSRGSNSVKAIKSICEKTGLTPAPRESTVRNLVTRYKKSNYNALSLLDKRKKMPWLGDTKNDA